MDDNTVLRCCRGMRSKTLEQRVACWRPFRRYLLLQGLGPWPRKPEHLLGYFELKVEENSEDMSHEEEAIARRLTSTAGTIYRRLSRRAL